MACKRILEKNPVLICITYDNSNDLQMQRATRDGGADALPRDGGLEHAQGGPSPASRVQTDASLLQLAGESTRSFSSHSVTLDTLR